MFKKIKVFILVFMSFIALSGCSGVTNEPNKDVRFIAHRGLSSVHYENTYDAFLAAGESDFFFGIETDVWFTMDNVPVTAHYNDQFQDKSKLITDVTYEEAMRLPLDLGKSKYIDNGEYYLCDFETYLDIVINNNKTPIIEIKGEMDEEQREILFEIIKSKTTLEDVVFISFNKDIIDRIIATDSNIYTQVLTSKYFATLSLRKKDYNLGVSFKRLSARLVRDLHERGYEVNVWTVNSKKNITKCMNLGVDYITTDYEWDFGEDN